MNNSIENHELANTFNRLTPDLVLNSLESVGFLTTGRVITLNSYENRVYQIELEDGRWVVGKFYRPGRWSKLSILEEHDFLKELDEQEIPVALPLQLEDGSTLGNMDGIMFALFPRIGGRLLEEPSEEKLMQVGRLIARIHNVGATRKASHRIDLNPDSYGYNNLEYLINNNVIPSEARENYKQTALMLLQRIVPMFNEVPVIRIHGDCHAGNLIESQAGATFLDFDDMVNAPAVQDVWMLAPSFDEYGQREREALLTGYVEFRDFNPAWLRLIEPLRALRFIHYSTWIAKRIKDPAFIKTFEYFGTVQYWQKETMDLREQIARIDSLI
ncbi:MAG: serine/threonine protein kinase [Deltaproteobacteria bacterium]|nr:serine/threonine protein kinase [Deltaproteobacteria bacterium]